MKYTLLEMVQLIMSAMDSEEVSNINDTTESKQVVDIIETTFNDIISTIDLPATFDLIQLEETSVATPTVMTLPENVLKLLWVQYDNSEGTARDFEYVRPLEKLDFLGRMNTLDTADANVYQYDLTVDGNAFDIRGLNDTFPTFYTSFDQRTLIFNNYKSSVDTFLSAGKTYAYAQMYLTFTREDSFVMPLDPQTFTLVFNEAKSGAFAELKQMPNMSSERRARRAWIKSQLNKHSLPRRRALKDLPDYGRN